MSEARLLLVIVGLTGCTPLLHSSATVDATPFQPCHCRSGSRLGFNGVELADAGGRRLRLAQRVDGAGDAYLFPPGAPTAATLGACGAMQMEQQSSRINGVTNVHGAAELQCSAGAHALAGHIDFKNCH